MNLILSILTFITISVPNFLLSLLSYTFTLQLNFASLLILALMIIAGFCLFHRHILSTQYSRLPKPESTPNYKSNNFDLKPDSFLIEEEAPPKPYPGEFLSSFLSSIKIFQYLEEPIFKEFSRYLNTRRILANETLFDKQNQEDNFYIVMDGHMQVFANYNLNHQAEQSNIKPESKPLLLTEVKNGGALSSLFTLLKLFTENVISKNHSEKSEDFIIFLRNLDDYNRMMNDSSQKTECEKSLALKQSLTSNSSNASLIHPNIIAKAVVDTTLAVIPGEAFHKVTQKFPNASAHIVQVILTRFQRVTCLTLYKYLGLSSELLTLERKITQLANYTTNDSAFDKEFIKYATDMCKFRYHHQNPKNLYSTSNKLNNPIAEINRSYSTLNLKRTSAELKQSIFHLKESYFELEKEKDSYRKLRADVFSCISDNIGIKYKNMSLVNQAGDLSGNMNRTLSYSHRLDDREITRTKFEMLENKVLDKELEFFYAEKGTIIANQGERVGGLYIVINGSIDVFVHKAQQEVRDIENTNGRV